MGKFTFSDSGRNRTKKTKSWLGVLLVLLGFSKSNYAQCGAFTNWPGQWKAIASFVTTGGITNISMKKMKITQCFMLLLCPVLFLMGQTQLFAQYCVPGISYVYEGFTISSLITTGGETNISNNTGYLPSEAAYGDFTALSASQFAGEEIDFVIETFLTDVRIWIDWNNNAQFEENEIVYSGNKSIDDYEDPFTGSFSVPEYISSGDYRMRIRVFYETDSFTPCESTVYGETEDYTFTVMEAESSCISPTDLGASISSSLAELFWTSDGTLFEVEYGLQDFTLGNGTLVTDITSVSTSISGLTADTNYHYYVRRDCGIDGLSLWTGPYLFYTGYCEPSTNWPGQWETIALFVTTGGITNISNDTGMSISPGGYGNFTDMSVSHFETGEVSFTLTTNDWLGINIWVDWNNNLEFEESEKVYASETTGTSFSGSITVPVGTPVGNYRMRVRGILWSNNPPPCGTIDNGETEDYTFTVIEVPTCMPPTQLGVNIITLSSAELFWTSGGTLFEVEYGLQNFTLGNGTPVIGITTTSALLQNLTSSTYYHYYVRRDCGEGDLSPWSGPYLFYTNYCEVSSSVVGAVITSFVTTGGITNISNDTGEESSPNGYGNFTGMSVSHFETGEVSFTLTTNGYSGINIWVDWNNNMMFEEDEKVYASGFMGSGTFTGMFSVPVGTPVGDYRIRVREESFNSNPSPCGNVNSGEVEDYTFTVIEPTCIPPIQLGTNIISLTSAELFWSSDEGTDFEVQYGLQNFSLGSGTTLTGITSTSVTLPDLEPDTYYHYYARRDCDGGNLSPWTGPHLFYMNYCEVSTIFWFGQLHTITSFTTIGGITNISNETGYDSSPNGYGDFTDMSVSNFETGEISFTVTPNGWLGVNIWIDWNNNMIFEEEEKVYSSGFMGNVPFTGMFSVPVGTPVGDYRMRVRGTNDGPNPPPCGTINDGETEDYTFTVIEIPTCMPPTQLGANIISLTSAELFWTDDEGTDFEVQYGLQNFSLGSGIILTGITNTSVTLPDLEPDTHHHYYVRKNCGESDYSAWAGPYLFYTNYCEALSTWSGGDYITSFVTTGGFSYNISNVSTHSLNGFGNYTDQSVDHFETSTIGFTVTTNNDLGVNVWVDWNNNMEFEESEKIYASGTVGSQYHTGSFFVPLGTPVGNYRIRIRAQLGTPIPPCGNISYGETEDYTFAVITPPTCLPPFVPTSTNISATSVLLEWQADGDLFDIEYGSTGFIQGTGTTVSGVGNPYVLSGITPGASYQYYVRQNCGEEDGYSTWNGPVTLYAGAYQGDIPTMLSANPAVDDNACAITPFSVEIPEGHQLVSLNVQYTMISYNTAWMSEQRSVLYSPTLNIGEAQVVAGNVDYPGIQTYSRNIDFVNGTTGTVEFVLKAWRTAHGSGCSTDHIYVVDGSWILTPELELIPTCPDPPTELGYTNITEDAVDLIWESEEGTLFNIQWGAIGFDPEEGEGTLISGIEDTYYTLSGLDSSIAYEFYVRRDCSTEQGEDYSVWVGPFKFNSGYCLPASTLGYYISSFITTGGVENINHTAIFNTDAYINHTDMVVSQSPGESFDFSTNFPGGQSGVRIWVDWNNDFVFEGDEEVFYLGSTSSNKSGTITIPEDVVFGNYTMRLRSEFGSSALPSACGNIQYGQALDFTLNVACIIPVPGGEATQQFTQGQALTDLEVTGVGLSWYAEDTLETILEDSTPLVHGVTYYVTSSNEYCQSEALAITVTDICFDFAAPAGEVNQTFTPEQTLTDLEVIGVGLSWYAEDTLETILEDSTPLVHGVTYYVTSSNEYCQSEALAITVTDICFDFAAPAGEANQTFTPGQTLADLDVTGIGLIWYAEATLTTVLEESTVLIHGTTYYVVSFDDDCQSATLAITVTEEVSTASFDRYAFKYYPNPVNEVLYFSSDAPISDVTVINMLGQKLNLPVDSQNTQVDMTGLPSGNYFISITIEGVNKLFKIIKH